MTKSRKGLAVNTKSCRATSTKNSEGTFQVVDIVTARNQSRNSRGCADAHPGAASRGSRDLGGHIHDSKGAEVPTMVRPCGSALRGPASSCRD